MRENPFADERAGERAKLVGDLAVHRFADPFGEPERKVLAPAREAARLDLWLKQAERQRRRHQWPERHRDQEHVDWRRHRVGGEAAGSAPASRADSASSGWPGRAACITFAKSA